MSSPSGHHPRAPDFFIVGHPKTGTTALYAMLREHPQVYFPALKEPGYLASDLRRVREPGTPGPVPQTMQEYLALFADAPEDRLVGEATSFYLASRTAATEIAALTPEAKIIAIFREPASFLRSLHLQLLQDQLENEHDLRRALELEPQRREGRSIPRRCHRPSALLYSQQVRYTEQLRRYHDAFGADRVRVLIYEEFRRDNEGTLRDVCAFLGIEGSAPIPTVEANPTVHVRSQLLDRTLHRLQVGRDPVSGALKAGAKRLLPRRRRETMLHAVRRTVVAAPPSPPDPALMAELRARYHPEVARLGEYLGRDLEPLWGEAASA